MILTYLLYYLLMPLIISFIWRPGLFRREIQVPKRSYILFGLTAVLNSIYLISFWNYEYMRLPRLKGAMSHVYSFVFFNMIWMAILGLMIFYIRRHGPSFLSNFTFHWGLFAWLYFHSFPSLNLWYYLWFYIHAFLSRGL